MIDLLDPWSITWISRLVIDHVIDNYGSRRSIVTIYSPYTIHLIDHQILKWSITKSWIDRSQTMKWAITSLNSKWAIVIAIRVFPAWNDRLTDHRSLAKTNMIHVTDRDWSRSDHVLIDHLIRGAQHWYGNIDINPIHPQFNINVMDLHCFGYSIITYTNFHTFEWI